MEKLTGSQRKRLKSLAHHLKPSVQVGFRGITESLIDAIDKSIYDHELIKVKFVDHKEKKSALSDLIAEKTSSMLIGIIGNIAIFYKQNPDEEKRKISI